MEKFEVLEAVAAPLGFRDVDTDRIIPARFLSKPRSFGLGKFAFHDMRYDDAGNERPEFPLNQAPFREARIIVADTNFGCGSSRESAVWALADTTSAPVHVGFRCVIAPSFGDIFYNNCSKNGVLAVRLPKEVCDGLRAQLEANPGAKVHVDLPNQTVTAPDGTEHGFEIDDFRKHCLVNGLDDVALTLQYADEIADYEANAKKARPWALDREEAAR